MTRYPRQVLTESLVLAAQIGDEAAFGDLYRLWHSPLRNAIRSRIRDESATDDILTEIWLGIARGIRGLDDPASFPAWAFRLTERRCSDWIRRRCRERRLESAAAAEADLLSPATLSATAPTDETLALRAAIARLPADQRQILNLYYDLGHSVARIASLLGIPQGTVKSRLFSLRESLKQKLNPGST